MSGDKPYLPNLLLVLVGFQRPLSGGTTVIFTQPYFGIFDMVSLASRSKLDLNINGEGGI